MTLSPAPQFSAPVALGEVAVKSTMGFARWWRERRFALISKSMKQFRDAKFLNGELHRLFGAPIDDASLGILKRLEELGSARASDISPRNP